MNKGQTPVVKPTEIERKIWATRNTPNIRKAGGLVRSKAFVFKDVLDWPDWYREPSRLNPEDWDNKLMSGCRGEWFAHMVEGRQRVLDVGCGFGFPSFYLPRYGHEVVGVDPSPSEIATAQEIAKRMETPGTRNTPTIQFEVIEQNKLPFDDDSFDAATLCTSLECMGEPEAILAEVKRVLKPGSPIAIEEEDRSKEPKTHPVWEKSRWAFFDNEVWLWYETRITDPYLDRRYMMRINPDGEIASKLKEYEPYIESKTQGLPVIGFDEACITWDDALAAVVEPTFSEAKGYDGPSLKKLLESIGFTNIRFFLQPNGAEFARTLEKKGLLASMPDDIRSVLRALIRSVPTTDRPLSATVSANTPGGPDG